MRSVRILSTHRRSRLARPTSMALVVTMALSATPLAQVPSPTTADDSRGRPLGRPVATASVVAPPDDVGNGRPSGRPDGKKIVPNRTVPKVTPPDLRVHFSETPTVSELTHARVLVEPLRPIFTPTDEETRALARAIERYATDTSEHRADDLEALATGPTLKAWRPSLLANIATLRAQEGYYSRAARYWDEVWEEARFGETRDAHAVADYAIGKRLVQASTFGQVSVLEKHLKEIDRRPVGSNAAHDISVARESFSALVNIHDQMFFSGPEALKAWLSAKGTPSAQALKTIGAYKAPHEGTSLTDLNDLARRAGVSMAMRYMDPSSDVPVPSIVHFKSDHYTAVIAKEGDRYRLRDVALGGELMISAAAMRDEMSGYLLVASAVVANVGRSVTGAEGQQVVGHCAPGIPEDDDPPPPPPTPPTLGPAPPQSCGMPGYSLHPMTAALLINDVPLFYTPPRGPAMEFHLGYNQRAFPHSNAIYGDVGPRWRYDWVSYVTDNNTLITAPYYYTLVTLRGGGSEQYDNATSIERTHWKSRARFQQMSFDPPRYERRLADGTVEIYELADRAASLPSRNIYLTQLIDPQGQTLTFTYDAQFRLVAVTDAVGQVTTLDYQDPSDPMLLTKVTDPFGRFAAMTYNAAGQLASITDAIGMTSRFAYGPADFVQAMTTPYGTTTFKTDEFIGAGVWQRSAEVTDPEGGRERIEYHISNAALSPTVPAGDVPAGFADLNNTMDKYTTLYWNKQAMAEAPGDLAHAVITRWLLGSDSPYAVHAVLRNVPHSIKRPLESRIWYRYPNQLSSVSLGQGEQPSQIARVLDDGSTQLTQFTYNDRGNVTSYTDPIGRQTTLTYDTNLIDVLEVRQTKSGGSDLLVSLSGYGTVHRPTSIVDAAGQGKTIVYNTAGQPLTVTNAKSEITTFAYDAGATGYLTSVTGPITGATVSYTYDPVGRVQSVTQPDGYAVGSAYDALNRVTLQTYPDGTSESFIYDKLNLIESRQRAGRVTRYFYDRAGRLTATRDPLGRIIRQEWCGCGQLAALVDGNGNRTSWTRDSRGRITTETRADGAQTTYVYDGTGRVRTVTDPKGQIATYMYAADDRVTGVTYSNTTVATSGVTFTFDPVYPRVTTMIDGTGTTVYTYRAAGTLGAGQVASVDGPLADDTMTYAYDELGRVISRAINGSANTVTWSFDPLGRVTSEVNVLGTFGYTYDGQTVRLATATYPNGQTSSYTYLPTNQNARLQTIHHKYPNGLTLSKFDYSYDAVGNIVTWRQQADAAAVQWTYGYDAVDQLTQAVKLTTDSTPVVLRRFAYSYDAAGNRVSEQIDDALTSATYNDRNELVSQQPSGGLTFVGAVNEPAAVFVDTHPMAVATNNSFRGTAAVSPGTSVVTVAATDPSGNTTSKNYQVSLSGASQTLTYDANGNLISDGSRLFEWDAENRLTAVTLGTSRSEFSYDGLSRRSRVLERANGLTIRDAKLIWSGKDIVEERLSTGELNRFYTGGESFNGLAGFLTVDHLRSSREITDSNGTVTIRNDYDPFGRLTRIIGTQDTRFSFGGFFNDQGAHISSAVYRAYDPEVGRWLSEDPIGLAGGINRFRYSANAVTKLVDPSGLNPKDPYYDPKYKDPGFRDYLERAKRDWGIPKGGQADRDEMEDIYNTWVSEGRPGRSKENKGREQKPPEPSQEQNDSGWEVPWWVPPAVVGGIVGLICILQPEACLPAAGAGLKMCPAR